MRRVLLASATVVISALGLPAPSASANAAPQHAAITITSNQGFLSCHCVTSGDGTAASPYVIGPWTITAPSGGTSGWSVKVDDSTGQVSDYFQITGITSAYNDANPSDPEIWLVDIHTPTRITSGQNASSSTAANDGGTGVRLDGSSGIALDGLSYNKMNGPGVYLNGSANVTINNSKFKSLGNTRPNGDGIYAVDSSNVQIGTGADCPANSPCVDTTYDNGYGIDLVDTHDVVINATTASSNDTGGFLLDGPDTYQVSVENSHATGIGPICVTANHQKADTGYYSDLQNSLSLAGGAHDNSFTSDTFSIPSGTGYSIASGGNGFFIDACADYTREPFAPAEPPAGTGNTFTGVCYNQPADYPGLPPSAANCTGA
jgi:hypothetical protein